MGIIFKKMKGIRVQVYINKLHKFQGVNLANRYKINGI